MQLRAGLLELGTQSAIGGMASGAWWDLDGFSPGTVEFAVPRARRVTTSLTVHTTTAWDRSDILRHRGLATTSVTRTVIDLADQGCPAALLERAIDSGVRKRLTSIPTLVRRIDELAGPGRGGVPLLRELILDAGGESKLERRFLRLMREAAMPRPQCQVVHVSGTGRVRRVDFEFTPERLVVEVSGRLGHTSDSDRQHDARRRNELQQAGFMVLEFTTADVLDDPIYVVTTVKSALVSRVLHVGR